MEGFRLAGEIRQGLGNLNHSLLRYTLFRDSKLWEEFEQASGALDRWIDDHDPNLNPHSPLTSGFDRSQLGTKSPFASFHDRFTDGLLKEAKEPPGMRSDGGAVL